MWRETPAYAVVFPIELFHTFFSLSSRRSAVTGWNNGDPFPTRKKRLPPKGLHRKTQEDVGSIVSIGFHHMGGPRWKNDPGTTYHTCDICNKLSWLASDIETADMR